MACYYLVISSTHLSNGHFRGIKGVFRGPLRKNGTSLPSSKGCVPSLQGYAEKEKAIVNALEDLKANFYCELCDKQYHKHQEFDNHINSYDHAHKQRLKELKQREFARNVASKSWKDERKQEKALKRLHQLAELRKQSECVSRGGPIFQTPRIAIGNQLQAGIFTDSAGSGQGARLIVTCEGHNAPSNIAEKQQKFTLAVGGEVLQPLPNGDKVNHRAGVSFCFSKKAQLKLESSASVFNESLEETSDGKAPQSLKEKHAADNSRSQALLVDEPAKKHDNVPLTPEVQVGSTVPIKIPADMKDISGEKDYLNKTPELALGHQIPNLKAKMHLSDVNGFGSAEDADNANGAKVSGWSLETNEPLQCQTRVFQNQQIGGNKHSYTLLMENSDESSKEKPTTEGQETEMECGANSLKTATDLRSEESVSKNEDTPMNDSTMNGVSPNALPFLNVISKDGNTVFQWPTELVLFTKTQPSISYSCNPLYFDFKQSQKSAGEKDSGSGNDHCDGSFQVKTLIGSEASGLFQDEHISSEQDDQSTQPKTKCFSNRLSPQNFEQNINDNQGGRTENVQTLSEDTPALCPNFKFSEKCDFEAIHSRKRKRKHMLSDLFSIECVNDQIPLHLSSKSMKKPKTGSCTICKSEGENRSPCRCTPTQKQLQCFRNLNGVQKDCTKDLIRVNHNRISGYDSDGCSISKDWALPFSQRSPSSRLSNYSECSIISSTARCSSPCLGHGSSKLCPRSHFIWCCKTRHNHCAEAPCKHRKHRHMLTSEEEADHISQTKCHRIKKHKDKQCIKKQKHKQSKKSSRHRSSHSKHRSKRRKIKHRLSKSKHQGSREQSCDRSYSRQRSSCESSNHRRSYPNMADFYSKERAYCLKANMDLPNNLEKGKTLQNTSINDFSHSRISNKCLSENSAGEPLLEERESLNVLLLEDKEELDATSTLKENSEDCSVELCNHSEGVFTVQLSPSVESTSVLPLPEKASAVDTSRVINCEVGEMKSAEENVPSEESQEYKVTMTPHTDNDTCRFTDLIRIGGQCHTLDTDLQAGIQEQSSPLISQVKPFMESREPFPRDFPCILPSNRYSVVTDSQETKEEQIRLELQDVNMNSRPLEEQLNYFYDGSMQNYSDGEHMFEVYSKPTSPSPSQQPVPFPPDEIDQYRLLQMQAQQHMHSQLLAKHLKVFPVNGPTSFSTAPGLQPIPVQQQTSITTIHHTLLQRCALTASMHPHSAHFPLTHVHPLSQSHFAPLTFSHLAPAVLPTHTTFLTGHPLHLFSATTIQPGQLTLQALPHGALIPTLFSPHISTGASPAIHLHPLIHPLFQGHELQLSAPSQPL
ncbi:zinc finger protein 804B [Lissotriton helveticus]